MVRSTISGPVPVVVPAGSGWTAGGVGGAGLADEPLVACVSCACSCPMDCIRAPVSSCCWRTTCCREFEMSSVCRCWFFKTAERSSSFAGVAEGDDGDGFEALGIAAVLGLALVDVGGVLVEVLDAFCFSRSAALTNVRRSLHIEQWV